MSDIVERLRLLVPSDSSGAAFDAVNEITRLRNELHIAQEWSARVIAGREQDIAEITALRAENERLKSEMKIRAEAGQRMVDRRDKENERLRAALLQIYKSGLASQGGAYKAGFYNNFKVARRALGIPHMDFDSARAALRAYVSPSASGASDP